MLRTRHILLAALILTFPQLLCSSQTMHPAGQQSANMPFTVEGKIVTAQPGKLTLGTGENIVFYVRYDENTKITKADGSAAKSSELQEGVHINVRGELDEKGDVIARTIQIEAAKKESGQAP